MTKCSCLTEMEKSLEEKGLKPVYEDGFQFRKDSQTRHFYALSTKKKNGHPGPPLIMSYCPLCGQKIWEDTDESGD